jgi:O-succinylbenzoic acid--CoA ligase
MTTAVPDWVAEHAGLRPGDTALADARVGWTYAELERRVAGAAAGLARAGLAPRDRVAMLAADGPPAVVAIHALRRIGAVLVPLNRRAAADELAWQVRAAAVAATIADADHDAAARAATDRRPVLDLATLAAAPAPGPDAGAPDVDLDAPATLVFTSGTTGRPKAAVLTHGNHLASAAAWRAYIEPRPGDRWLACLPFHHVAGLAMVVRASLWGVELEIAADAEPATVHAGLERGATHVSLVPTILERLLARHADEPAPPALRAVLLGGGPVAGDLVRRARAAGYPIHVTYGMTETASGVAAGEPGDGPGPPTVGRALPGAEIATDPPGASADAPGEILVRGPMVFAGYDGDPAATAAALDGGWLRTGDLGWLDAMGRLVVADRREDLLVSGGENVYPAEVEAVLLAHPAVADAAVVGRPDPAWGAVPVAIVVTRPGAAPADAELAEHCRTRLAAYKVPRAFHRRASLPRTAAGKLRRSEIRSIVDGAGA